MHLGLGLKTHELTFDKCQLLVEVLGRETPSLRRDFLCCSVYLHWDLGAFTNRAPQAWDISEIYFT